MYKISNKFHWQALCGGSFNHMGTFLASSQCFSGCSHAGSLILSVKSRKRLAHDTKTFVSHKPVTFMMSKDFFFFILRARDQMADHSGT